MGNIVLLDELTINKIAAGEVIERPASVIKEAVENSIDAGATVITVEIKNGGISYIRISDNGKGIAQDDLEIAFERHATSKIRCADDLEKVKSMGFRGEALASIAAIASVELVSKTQNQNSGYKVIVKGGEALEKEEVAAKNGTIITIKDLFYNTPVRYKFLKKDYTESGYIEDVLTRIALVHPEIAIKLINTGKTVLSTNGNGEIKDVVYCIFGADVAGAVIETKYLYEDIMISGVIGKPEIARSNRGKQTFFVNKRYIKDKTVSSAAEQAYKGMIPIGKYGFIILNIEVNPAKVDVNVHPAKTEVRFQEENKIFQGVYHAIKETLLKTELVAGGEPKEPIFNEKRKTTFEERLRILKESKKENEKEEHKEEYKSNTGLFGFRKNNEEQIKNYTNEESTIKTNNILEDIAKTKFTNIGQPIDTQDVLSELSQLKGNEEKQNNTDSIKSGDEIKNEILEETKEEYVLETKEKEEKIEEVKEKIEELENNPKVVLDNFEEMYVKLFGNKPITITDEDKEKEEQVKTTLANVSLFHKDTQKPEYKFIGIAFNTYIIIEIEKEIYILDQHAAHERITYEQAKKSYYEEGIKESQLLLLPDIITLTAKEMDIAKDNFEMFRNAGFELEEFGENTIKLSGVPPMCIELNTKELFLETLDEINTVARTAKQEKEEKFIATVACKAAVKGNMILDPKEVDVLLVNLLQLPNPFTCPHGRPIAIKMSKYEIERKFARK